jgi:hypothetical protein
MPQAAPAQAQTLAALVRAKYPGAYDDIDDATLEQSVKSKYPGVYDDIPTTAQQGGGRAMMPLKMPDTEPIADTSLGKQVKDAAVGLWEKQPIHPIDAVSGLAQAAAHPIETVTSLLKAQGKPFELAQEAYGRGDYLAAASHMVNWLTPVLGPQIADAQERARTGELSMGGLVGESAGIGLQAGLPGALKNASAKVPVTPKMGGGNPVVQDAVAFGQRQGIPVDAGTATQNRAIQGAQYLADRSLGGSIPAKTAGEARDASMTRVGRDLTNRAYPQPMTPESAGAATRDAVVARAQAYQAEANTAYDALRKLEADPKHLQTVKVGTKTENSGVLDARGNPVTRTTDVTEDIPMAVDLRSAKRALRPIYDRLMRQYSVTQREASSGLKALENVVNGPDYSPLSIADADLGAIKTLARTDNAAGTRNVSQGTAAAAVAQLEQAVMSRAARAGKDVVDALKAGRKATIEKYQTSDLADSLKKEPVRAFNEATAPNDASINSLRQIARVSPDAPKQMGRAYLDKMMNAATAEGGYGRGAKLFAEWERLGPQTKKLMFAPDHLKDLDRFFLLGKKMAETPNPSGSGAIVSLGSQGALVMAEPVTGTLVQLGGAALSKFLHSPAGVRILTRGLTVPVKAKPAAAAVFGQVVKEAERLGVTLSPVRAEDTTGSDQ